MLRVRGAVCTPHSRVSAGSPTSMAASRAAHLGLRAPALLRALHASPAAAAGRPRLLSVVAFKKSLYVKRMQCHKKTKLSQHKQLC